MQTEHKLKKITSLTSLVIATAIIITIPAGYFITSYSYESRFLQEQVDLGANLVSKHIYTHPDTWQFQENRLESILSNGQWQKSHAYYEILNNQNEGVVDVGQKPSYPYLTAHATLTDGITQVGYIKAQASLQALLIKTTIAFILAILIAISVYMALRILPFAALERAMDRLELSRKQLALEVSAKQNALIESAQVSEKLQFQATHDMLTGLANRRFFQDTLAHSIQLADNKSILSVLIIDLNHFKEINDTLGHEVGDQVLIAVSHRIGNALSNNTILARLGGDEYAILIDDTSKQETLTQINAITNSLKSYIDVNSYHLDINASIGVAYYPEHGSTRGNLMRHADIAMYHAKQNLKEFCQYDESYNDENPNRLTLTTDLRQALNNDLLTLHY